MDKKLNASKNKLISALKKSLEKKKQFKELQERSVIMVERLIPLFNELGNLTEKAEKKVINTELEIRLLEDIVKDLSQLQTIRPKDETKVKTIIKDGKNQLVNSQIKRNEELAVVESISREYNDLFGIININFDSNYKAIKEILDNANNKTNGNSLSGSELLTIMKRSGKMLKSDKGGNNIINIRYLFSYE